MALVRLTKGGGGGGELHGAEIVVTIEEDSFSGAYVYLYKGSDITPIQTKQFPATATSGVYTVSFVNIQEVGTYKVKSSNGTEETEKGDISITSEMILNKTPTTIQLELYGAWGSASNEIINRMLTAHYNGEIDVSDYWAVGDTRTIHLSEISSGGDVGETQPSQTVQLVILAFKHDNLVTPINGMTKSAVTVQLKDCLSVAGYANSSDSKIHWTSSGRYNWCNNSFYNALPEYLMNLVKTVSKPNYTYSHTNSDTSMRKQYNSNDKVFLLSRKEYHGVEFLDSGTYSGNPYNGEQYEYYSSLSNIVKTLPSGTANNSLMTRTVTYWNNVGYTVNAKNMANTDQVSTKFPFLSGIAPAFCL